MVPLMDLPALLSNNIPVADRKHTRVNAVNSASTKSIGPGDFGRVTRDVELHDIGIVTWKE